MRITALATDYDGTIAHDGAVDAPTLAALERLRVAHRKLILVTGRALAGFDQVMPRLDLFDRVIGENGAVMLDPATGKTTDLADPPPVAFVDRLRAEGVALSVGRVIVSTGEPNEAAVRQVIGALGLALHIVLNKGAVMILPSGVDKGSGVRRALADLGSRPENCAGVGDAENDIALLKACGLAVAVANALPELKAAAMWTTEGNGGTGVAELIERILTDDLVFPAAHRECAGRFIC